MAKSNVIPNQLADTWACSVSSLGARRGAARLLQPGGEGTAWGGSDRSCPKMHPAEHWGGGVIVIALCCFQMMGNGWDPEPQLTRGAVVVRCAVPCCPVPCCAMGTAGAMLPGWLRSGALLPRCMGAELSHVSRQPGR